MPKALISLNSTQYSVPECTFTTSPVLDNPKLRKKYAIPHSYRQLKDMQNRLETMRYDILKYKIPEKRLGIVVQYPTGYEG